MCKTLKPREKDLDFRIIIVIIMMVLNVHNY